MTRPGLDRFRPGLALTVFSFALTAWFAEGSASAAPAYVRSVGGEPWGQVVNDTAMDMVFGGGEWDDLRFETVDPDVLFSPAYQFIYMDGSDSGADDLQSFLSANQTAMEQWVDDGGSLFLNCGPNVGGGQDWGFGGVAMNIGAAGAGHASDPEHPIWQGPFLPAATNFTGGSYAHSFITGPSLVAVITTDDGSNNMSLSELDWGGGRVLFGGLTTSNFWAPQPDALNMRANMISYLAAGDEDEDGFNTFEDNCPTVANADQADGDGDEVGDVCDACPADANDYLDSDGDGDCDNADNCPEDANANQSNGDGDVAGDVCDACPVDVTDWLDSDADGLCNNADGCPFSADPLQTDGDADGVGDACDACPIDPLNDIDNDNDCGNVDNCPDLSNANQIDQDADGLGDACDPCDLDVTNDADGDFRCADNDNCPLVNNPSQSDADEDTVGDECDPCSNDVFNDLDDDGVCADVDNCPNATNADQADVDDDGLGDICDDDPNTPPATSSSSEGGETGDDSTGGESSSESGGATTLTTSNDDTSDDSITSLTATAGESSSSTGDGESSSSEGGDDGSQSGDDGGCNVAGGNRGTNAGWLALAVLGLLRRRRR